MHHHLRTKQIEMNLPNTLHLPDYPVSSKTETAEKDTKARRTIQEKRNKNNGIWKMLASYLACLAFCCFAVHVCAFLYLKGGIVMICFETHAST